MTLSSNTLYFVGVLRATGNVLPSVSWITDSGETHHVYHDRTRFLNLSETLNQLVSIPTGLGVKIIRTGQVKINENLILKNVLYILDFRLNLISVSQMTRDLAYRVAFDSGSCMIHDLSKGLMISQGEEITNLYILDEASIGELSTRPSSFCANVVLDSALWHNGLGHPAIQKIDSISNVLGIPQRNKTFFHCSICPRAKQKNISFPSPNNMSIKPFDLLHIDTWGPFSVTSNEGYRYFLTIVDDHTRVTWIYLMRTKDEILTLFPKFFTMVEMHYKTTVKGVRSDNTPELKFSALYKAKGITAFHSCPETPEQNSVVQRKHQHILNVARSLMFQAKLGLEYWSDCVLTSVLLLNRLPAPLLKDKSPYQMLTSKQPDYTRIRTFGCLCYVSTSSKNIHQFQPRAKASIFLGYPSGYKGYKVMDLETNVISISRNVVFHEDIFPFDQPEDLTNIFGSPMTDDAAPARAESTTIPVVVKEVPASIDPSSSTTIPAKDKEVHASVDSSMHASYSGQKRSSKTPAYLQDYYCNMTETNIPYPLVAHASYDKLFETYKNYICSIMHNPEPSSFAQAKKFDEGIKAMNEELIALESTDTWEVYLFLMVNMP